MSYIGGLTKAQMAAFLTDELRPLIQEVKALKQELSELRGQLGHKAKELYTIEDLSRLFNVTKATIHNWVKEGKLVKYKTGARSLFKKDDVQKFIDYSKTK
jgi:excisionase family DNA binding protein